MKSILTLGMITFALTFCGLGDKLKGLTGSGGSNTNTTTTGSNSSSTSSTSSTAEKAKPNAAQQSIIDGGTETKWDDQGLAWKLPAGWKKMDVKKESFNYSSPDNAFLLVNISVLGDNFPAEISLKAYYDQAMQQLKNGKYESVKMVEIDGIQASSLPKPPKARTIRDATNGSRTANTSARRSS
ncbi:MAG: hypothetical protein IPK98_19720 [Chloracidobacterium sp.]|nr:hypothetical protein [Chloracidobacterium sp.]